MSRNTSFETAVEDDRINGKKGKENFMCAAVTVRMV
jgi:hypothetical protein